MPRHGCQLDGCGDSNTQSESLLGTYHWLTPTFLLVHSSLSTSYHLFRHYLTVARQAELLHNAISNWVLAECWSQEKNRLMLRFIRGGVSRFVELSLDLHFGYALLHDDFHRARRNTLDFFEGIIGVQLAEVAMHEGERVVEFHFADGTLLLSCFFGKGAGNVLIVRDGKVVESFQHEEGEYYHLLQPNDNDDFPTREEIIQHLRNSSLPASKALQSVIPSLGRRLATEALYRTGVTEFQQATDEQLYQLLDAVDTLYKACQISTTFYLYHLPAEAVFTLVELHHLQDSAVTVETFDNLPRAIRACRAANFRLRRLLELRTRMARRLESERMRLQRALAKGRDDHEHQARAAEWEQMGNMLVANLYHVAKGMEQVELTDWEGNRLMIPLNVKLAPHENAERYFRRARGVRQAAGRAAERLAATATAIEAIAIVQKQVEQATEAEELEKLLQSNKKLFAMTGEPKEEGTAERFRRFEVAGGYEVYAGKSATNNDELTVRFARPNDYWFHARGSSGSHVVLRWNDAKTKPPKEVLRQAASIAAFYSGAKNAKMVPVAYTLKKHVRKPRGAAVGAVVMEREEVILVEPKLPEGKE